MESNFITTERKKYLFRILPHPLQHPTVLAVLESSLSEDLSAQADLSDIAHDPASGDITSIATLEAKSILHGRITAKAGGTIAGMPVVQSVFYLVDSQISFKPKILDGQPVVPGSIIADIEGRGISLLAAERTALNFLGRMSGIATLTQKFSDAVSGTQCVILDTRKTAPGLRLLEKYAVKMGGGENHRSGLFDMVLIKDNHIDGAGSIQEAVRRARQLYGSRFLLEVEVKNLDELLIALSLPVDRIMLDNMNIDLMKQAVMIAAGRVPLEASGNVNLMNVREIAETGVDYISIGALTHSAPVLDISMRLQ